MKALIIAILLKIGQMNMKIIKKLLGVNKEMTIEYSICVKIPNHPTSFYISSEEVLENLYYNK